MSITLYLGPMFSSKTRSMIEEVRKYLYSGKKCVIIRTILDTRSGPKEIITHSGEHIHETIGFSIVSTEYLHSMDHIIEMNDVVGIDEGQFFPDIAETSEKWANKGKIIIISALDGTFERKPFESILYLIPLAENVKKLHAVCMICGNFNASFSKRITPEKEVISIGGSDKYIAVCRKCFLL